ncbi:MAG: hypothetical protein MJ252_22745 [archaeon]|nr:hypothetical protein [archaeon]
MKAFFFVALFMLAACHNVKESNDWVDALKCVVDNALPLKEDIFKLIDAIVAKDTGDIVAYVLKLSGEVSEIYLKCFENQLELAFDWKAFGKCIINKAKEAGGKLLRKINFI